MSVDPGEDRRRARWRLWWPVVAYMTAIFGMSSLSSVPGLPAGLSDKQVHALLYSGLSAVALRALAGGSRRGVTLRACAGAVLISTGYGVFDEYHQLLVPGRSFEVLDMAADAAGASAAAAVLLAWGIIWPRNGPGARNLP